MLNAQPEIADAPLDRTVAVVKALNDKRRPNECESRGEGGQESLRLRVDFLECELDLLKFDLRVQVERQAKLVALSIARERLERSSNDNSNSNS